MWRCLKQGAAKQMGHMYTPMEAGEACTILQSRTLGTTRLRYIPKKTGEHTPSFEMVLWEYSKLDMLRP